MPRPVVDHFPEFGFPEYIFPNRSLSDFTFPSFLKVKFINKQTVSIFISCLAGQKKIFFPYILLKYDNYNYVHFGRIGSLFHVTKVFSHFS